MAGDTNNVISTRPVSVSEDPAPQVAQQLDVESNSFLPPIKTATSSPSASDSSLPRPNERPSESGRRTSVGRRSSARRKYRPATCFVHNLLEVQRLSQQDYTGASEPVSPQLGAKDTRDIWSTAMTKKELSDMALGVRELSKRLGSAKMKLRINKILIVTKVSDDRLTARTREIVTWILQQRRDQQDKFTVYVEDVMKDDPHFGLHSLTKQHPQFISRLKFWTPELCTKQPHMFDFVITLGGDGTVLYTSWLFQRVVPPVLSFSLGTLGFLTMFDFNDFESILTNSFDQGVRASLRMRFECSIVRCTDVPSPKDQRRNLSTELLTVAPLATAQYHEQEQSYSVLNELVVDRGPNASMSSTELFGDDEHLTSVQADGLCVSTPTGSTAYSLAAGGSLCHPEIAAILISPICPHSLSFRPLLVPDSVVLRIAVPYDARSSAWISFDGRNRVELSRGDYVTISASRFPFPTVSRTRQGTDWIESIRHKLAWNERERQASW